MTLEEARKVAAIIERADGGCSACVSGLTDMMAEAFPEFEWTYDDSWGAEDHDVKVTQKELAHES